MLDTFRSSVRGIVAKILLALLFLSFVAWGIGDMLSGPSTNQAVATVGNNTISATDFSRALYKETNNLRAMMGGEFTPEMMQGLNLPPRVLQGMITRELLLLESRNLGLVPTDEEVVRRIRENPAFLNVQGEFDKAQFNSSLRGIGLSEKEYVAGIRDEIAINLLLDTLYSTIPITAEVAPVILRGREHERKIKLYALDTVKNPAKFNPTDDDIQSYYKTQNASFITPEQRKVSYLTVNLDNITLDEKAAEEALREQYDLRKEDFTLPEKREVSQLLFSTKEMAEKALEKAAQAKSFDKIAKDVHALNEATTDMGLIKRENIIEEAAEEVFGLEVGAVTKPIESPFGWHIFKVTKIQPAKTLTFEEVRGQIENEVNKIQKDSALVQRVNEIEDAIAGGANLKEVAAEYSLEQKTTDFFNNQGYGPNGKKVENLPELAGFIDVAFQTEKDQISSVVSAGGGQFFVMHVDEVVEEHAKQLEDVRENIINSLKQIHKNAQLQEKAAPLSEAFAGNSDHSKAIREYGLNALGSFTVKRNTRNLNDIETPAMLIADIFKYKVGEGTNAYPSGKHGYLVAIIEKDLPYKLDTKSQQTQVELESVTRNLSDVARSELLDQYARYLKTKYEITVNQELIQSILQQQ